MGGYDALSLAQRYGTPLYAYDENRIRENCRRYIKAFRHFYPGPSYTAYAAKAFWCLAMARLIKEEGLRADVASAGELYTAIKAGIPGEHIYLHGNCKTREEIEMALKHGVRGIIVDNETEISLIENIAGKKGIRAPVLLRVTLGVEAATHHAIRTGHWDTKFGIYTKGGLALRAARKALLSPHLNLYGFHAHIGSQIFNLDHYEELARGVFQFLDAVRRETGFEAKELDLGGGLAVPYTEKTSPSIETYARVLSRAVTRQAKRRGYPLPALITEPGRSIVAAAGATLYTVRYMKRTPFGKIYAIVDGGLSDNPRPAMYGAKHQAVLIKQRKKGQDLGLRIKDLEKKEVPALSPKSLVLSSYLITVAGKHCESDTLLENIRLPEPRPGDILAVFSTGAYNYSMASNYNRYPKPAVAFIKNGKAKLAVRRETLQDLIRQDI